VAAGLERLGTEIRHLQRSEVGEAEEPFGKRQKGSSSMPHKRNPIRSERLVGLSRLLRGHLVPAFENAPLWHERDLTNSSAERFTMSHQMVLTEYILLRSVRLFQRLEVDADAMRANLERAGPDIMAEAVMMALVGKGIGRQEAHEMVRSASMASKGGQVPFIDSLLAAPGVIGTISRDELEAALRPGAYTGHAEELVDLALRSLEN